MKIIIIKVMSTWTVRRNFLGNVLSFFLSRSGVLFTANTHINKRELTCRLMKEFTPLREPRLIRAGSDSSQLVKSPLRRRFTVTASVIIWCGTQESYLPFNLQPVDVAMSPNGEMWYREETYSPDFSLEDDIVKKHRFMHEMMHVWQTQKGMFVRIRGLFSGIADYTYSLDKVDLLHYGLEQQASIVKRLLVIENTLVWRGMKNYYNTET